MAVAHVVSSASHASGSFSVSQSSFSWTHTTSTDPQGVLVFVFQGVASADAVTSVTYDGVTVPAVTGGRAIDTATELGATAAYFLGSSVPATNNPTVVVNRTSNTTTMWAVAATVTAAGDTETTGVVLLQENGTLAVQSVDDGSVSGANSVRYAGAYYGGASPAPAGTGSTLLHSDDAGAYGWSAVRETTAGQGARNVGFTQATSDDRAAVHLAVREVVPAVTGVAVAAFGFTGEASGATGGGGMALAVDASTPAYVTNANDPWTTASFTPPVGSLLVVVVSADWFGGTPTIAVTSSGLTFTSRIKVGAINAGVVEIFTAEVGAAGGSARTVAGTTTIGDDSGGMKVYVVTGQHATSYVDTTGSGSSTTNNITPTVLTTGFDGCWVFGGAEDWQNLGAATSTDVFENGTPGGIAPICVRKSAATSPAGAVTLNFDAAGTGTPTWRWAAISIRPAAGGGSVTGVATGTFGFTATASGVPRTPGSAVATFGFTATASGVDRAIGAAVTALGFTATAQGVDRSVGAALATLGFTATALGTVGTPPVTGAATAAFGFTATASGVPRTSGGAVGSFGFTAGAAGIDRAVGVAAAAFGFVGSASGVDRAVGAASGAFGFAASASGVPRVFAVAVAVFGFTATAQGFAGTPPVAGVAAGLFGFTATAQGQPRTPGAASASFGFTGSALGRPRVVAGAVGGFGFVAVSTGVRVLAGTAQATFGFAGFAAGQGATVSADSVAMVLAAFTSTPGATVAATSTATVTGN